MAFVYRITINRDLVNSENRGIDLLEPGGWVTDPIAIDKERGMHVETAGEASRVAELFLTETVLRYQTLLHVDVSVIEFWTHEAIDLNPNKFNPPRDWTIDFLREED